MQSRQDTTREKAMNRADRDDAPNRIPSPSNIDTGTGTAARRRVLCRGKGLLAFCLCGVLLGAPAAWAQEEGSTPSPDDLEQFEDRAGVFEVQVPVNVVDRDGAPVRDLTMADFEVFDKGERQELTGFHVIDLDTIEPDPLRPNEAEQLIPSAARRYFLFLFDLSFSAPSSVVRARQAARDFVLNDMHPTDLAAVATHAVEGGAKLIMTFSPDRAQLARAIDTLGAPRLLALQNRDPLRFLVDLPEVASLQAVQDASTVDSSIARTQGAEVSAYLNVIGRQMIKQEKSYAMGRVSTWSVSMGSMAELLGGIEGRKHVVLFSEGFDGRLMLGRQPDEMDPTERADIVNIQNGQYHMVDNDDRFGNTQIQGAMNVMVQKFREAGAVIQAVDISGLRADLPAEHRSRRVGQDALYTLANDTGGTLYEDANDFGAELAEVLRRSTVTYLLSYTPSEMGEAGEYRRLDVKVEGHRGSNVSHRQGYKVPRPFQDLHPMEKSLLAADLIATATLRDDFDMHVLAAPFRATEQEAYLPVIIEIAGAGLLADHEAEQLPVEFYTYVTDQNGEMRDFFTQKVTLNLTDRDAFVSSGLKYYGHIDLEPGEYMLRVLARNSSTGRTSVRTVQVDVPEYAEQALSLLPPFFLEEPGSWFLVREQRPGDDYRKSTVYPFTVNGEPYIPSAKARFEAGDSAELCLVAYNFGAGQLQVDTQVIGVDGATVDGGRLAVKERTVTGIEGLDKVTATFETDGLAAGDYTLQVALIDPSTQTRQVNQIPFRVDG